MGTLTQGAFLNIATPITNYFTRVTCALHPRGVVRTLTPTVVVCRQMKLAELPALQTQQVKPKIKLEVCTFHTNAGNYLL